MGKRPQKYQNESKPYVVKPAYLQFSQNPAATLLDILDEIAPDRIAVLVDENTKKHCLPLLNSDLPIIEIKSGEKNKTLTTCDKIWMEMTDLGFSRKSLLINLGGGVIGDMGGFAASTYKRGIRFVNFPTTLLSMVDASIGGKLGIDFHGLKNHIGVFQEPTKVVVSDGFLETLPEDQIRSGFAEILKHALIHDQNYWQTVKKVNLAQTDWSGIIHQSVEIKNKVVLADPKENGLRKILNFGHSLGHAIETHFLDSGVPLLHGEAIAIGMILEGYISTEKKILSKEDLSGMVEVISSYFELPTLPGSDELLTHLKQDKKNQGEVLNFSLIERIGSCKWDVPVTKAEIECALESYSVLTQRV